MELADCDLYSYVDAHGPLCEDDAVRIFSCIVDALRHCHAHGIYHGDVKPENILLFGRQAKLADFGTAVFSGGESTSPCGTIQFGAPETLPIPRDRCV